MTFTNAYSPSWNTIGSIVLCLYGCVMTILVVMSYCLAIVSPCFNVWLTRYLQLDSPLSCMYCYTRYWHLPALLPQLPPFIMIMMLVQCFSLSSIVDADSAGLAMIISACDGLNKGPQRIDNLWLEKPPSQFDFKFDAMFVHVF